MTSRIHLSFVTAALVACGAARTTQRVNFPDGTPHWEAEFLNGVPNGTTRVYWPTGNVRSQGPYRDGRKEGTFLYYDEDGHFDHQTLFRHDVDVWHSQVLADEPPPSLLKKLSAQDASLEAQQAEDHSFEFSSDPVPAPYFATLDRAASAPRAGVGFGVGELRRMELFANYRFAQIGVYGEVAQTDLLGDTMTYSGRRTLELGGTHQLSLDGVGTLTTHAGALLPIGNDNPNGFVASAATANVSPGDAAASFPQAFAIRTGASFTHAQRYFVAQADAGVDWLLAGQERSLDALLRANAGIGVGVRAAMLGVELTNAFRASDLSRNVSALGLTGTVSFAQAWLTGAFAYGFAGTSTITILAGHDL